MAQVVSVIVPAYNVAPYIEECVLSLIRQTVPLDIIVVNDGSTDDTSERVNAVHPGIHSVTLIEQQNQGLSAARNAGLRSATGQFVGFVDGDDWVADDMFATMVAQARAFDAELVICNGEMVDHRSGAGKPFHDNERFRSLAARHTASIDPLTVPDVFRLDTCACKRLYSRSLLEKADFQFAEGLLFEDVLAHYQLLLAAKRCLLLDSVFYRYRINHPGRITDRRDRTVLTIFEILRRSQDSLRVHRVSGEVWANFIWFQSWVLRWLASQVDSAHQEMFLREVVQVGRLIPRRGLRAFQSMFADDQVAQQAVTLQLFGCRQSLKDLVTHGRPDGAVREGLLRPFAPFMGRLRPD